MNLLDIDFENLKKPIIDAFTFVYGEKYRDVVRKQINNTCFIYYFDVDGIYSYINYLRGCKDKELSLRFLDKIGVSTCYDRSNYTPYFDDATLQVLDNTIDCAFAFSKLRNLCSPLCAFDENNPVPEDVLQQNKLKIINYFLQEKGKQLSLDEVTAFMKSDEYSEIYQKIERYRNIYHDLLKEYSNWEKSLSPYLEFINTENERKNNIYQEKKKELFLSVYPMLPKAMKDAISDKDVLEQEKIVFGEESITSPTLVERFAKKQMDKLTTSTSSALIELGEIRYDHKTFFNQLGITLPFQNLANCDTEEKLSSYLDFLKQEKIQQYIPSQDVISFIEKTRIEKMEEAYLEYLSSRSDYQKIVHHEIPFPPDILSMMQRIIQNKMICVTIPAAINEQGDIIPFLCYTVRKNVAGYLDYLLLHECGHAIEKTKNGCGLQPDYTYNNDSWYNPYDNNFRVYEKINENLNDIFTLEALDYLHKNDIYLLEPKEIVQLDCQDQNTYMATKKLLFPLLEKFREEVIEAKINVNPSILTQCIGVDNYEVLVDAVNKVDYLCRNDLEYLLKYNPDAPMCKEYQKQLERASEIYSAIDTYYDNHYKDSKPKPTSESKKN